MPVVIPANRKAKPGRYVLLRKNGSKTVYGKPKRTGLKKLIKKMLYKEKELKSANVYSGVANYNAAASVAGDIVRTIPSISQGDEAESRDGREIIMMKHVIKGCVAVNGSSSPDLYVDIWCVEDKQQTNFVNVDAATAFLTYYNGSMVPTNPGGLPLWQEIAFRLNRDRFIIKRKRIKLGFNAQPASAQAANADPTVPLMKTFTMTRSWKRGRKLKYQYDVDTLPSNYNTYVFFSVGSYDETYYGTLSTTSIKASVSSCLYFKDN